MDIKKLTEELSDYIEDKIDELDWESLDDIIRLGKEVPNEDLPEYLQEVLAPENISEAMVIKLWGDIRGGFGNQAEIIKLMREDLNNYISEEIADLKAV